MRICPSCGEESPERFRRCGFCGAELGPALPPQEVRKTVTVVFCRPEGLDRARGAHRPRVAARGHEPLLRRDARGAGAARRRRSRSSSATRSWPSSGCPGCTRTTRCAPSAPRPRCSVALAELNDELDARWGVQLASRTGVNTGEVSRGTRPPASGSSPATPSTSPRAWSRRRRPGEILLGELTYRLVRDTVDVEPCRRSSSRARASPSPAYRLLAVHEAAAGARSRASTAIVGRERGARAPACRSSRSS